MAKDSKPIPAKMDHDYETEGHARTIVEAHQIMSDPHKMKKVMKHLKKQKKAISSVQDLKDHYASKYGPGAEPDGDENE